MNDKNSITIVTSLPRSGTTTICEMAKICGFRPCHVLKEDLSASLEKYNFFADLANELPEEIQNSGIASEKKLTAHQNEIDLLKNEIERLKYLAYNFDNPSFITMTLEEMKLVYEYDDIKRIDTSETKNMFDCR